jgi:hypothetical protein
MQEKIFPLANERLAHPDREPHLEHSHTFYRHDCYSHFWIRSFIL